MSTFPMENYPAKHDTNVNSSPLPENDSDFAQVEGKEYDAKHDRRDMNRLGKRQELKRRFRFFSIVGYVIVLGLTWEFSIVTSIFSLANGGTAGAIWLTLIVTFGMFTVMMSMAELASMAPTSGGQYHWVSEFAPASCQKQLSYAVGWLVCLGWQSAMPAVAYIGAQQTLALIYLCKPDYVLQGWHGALLTIAFVLFAILFNTSAIGKMPIIEGLAVVLHVFGFFAFLIILWVMGPRAPAEETFTTFADDMGWGSLGLATLVGMVGPTTTFAGSDSAVHLAEELKDAGYILPRAMFSASIINYVLGFIMTITFMSALGDIEADLSHPSGQPWVAVIERITGSRAATIVLTLIMMFMFFFCAINQVTTSSRQVFAFARDKGLPYHEFLSRVNANGVPANAVYVTLAYTCILALIIMGSTTAFNIIASVATTGLFTSYLVVIAVVLVRKLRNQPFPVSRFEIPRTIGIVVNFIAVCFLCIAFLFLFFPAGPAPAAADMNWAIAIYGAAVFFSISYYYVRGRHQYDGPVSYVRHDYDRTL